MEERKDHETITRFFYLHILLVFLYKVYPELGNPERLVLCLLLAPYGWKGSRALCAYCCITEELVSKATQWR